MSALIPIGLWSTSEPSEAFERSGLGIPALITAMRRRLSSDAKACGEQFAETWFRMWVMDTEHLSALIIPVSEILCEELPPLFIYAVADRAGPEQVTLSLRMRPRSLVGSTPTDMNKLEGMCVRCSETSPIRALMAGELLIWARNYYDKEMVGEFVNRVKARFNDGNVVDDLGMMLVLDIESGIINGRIPMPQDMDEFERIAMREMNRRKVDGRNSVLKDRLFRNITQTANAFTQKLGVGTPKDRKRPIMA